jgi:hypothetical protein
MLSLRFQAIGSQGNCRPHFLEEVSCFASLGLFSFCQSLRAAVDNHQQRFRFLALEASNW